MVFTLNQNDGVYIKTIAEYRILTADQIARISRKGKQSIYRRLRCLTKNGFVCAVQQYLGQKRGRPQTLYDLTDQGIAVLKEKGLLSSEVSNDYVSAEKINCKGHQLLMNWFRIYLNCAQEKIPVVKVHFLAHNSPFLPMSAGGYPSISDFVPPQDSPTGEMIRFTPDGVFTLTDTTRNLSVLFFLEVDCGSETLASPKRDLSDVRQKIINYQACFLSGRYQRYAKLWRCNLEGFRLLFLTPTTGRLAALCHLTQQMGSAETDFVWLTEQNRLVTEGISAAIWFKAGDLTSKPKSIFGSLSYPIMPQIPVGRT